MRKLLAVLLISVMWLAAYAVPARPGIYTFKQSDGTTIHLSRVGDEWNSSFITTDGLTVDRDNNGDFYYRDKNGLTAMRAHDAALRGSDENQFVASRRETLNLAAIAVERRQNQQLPEASKLKARIKAAQSINPVGTQYIPVILVSYSDVTFKDSNPVATFTSFFTSGNTSVTQYFKDQSDSQFDPKFEILGHVTLSNNRAYYGGHSSTWGNDARCGTMVAQACLGISGVDWTKYDNNNDGEIDAVIVIYAGVGEASSDVDDAIWPCRWQIYGSDYGYRYVNVSAGSGTKRVNNFGVFNELSGFDNSKIDGIGTVCHEFSHVLGLPDYYATDYSNHFGMGDWSLMDGGCYNNNGYTPCAYASYEKMFMGWRELEDAVPGTTYTLAANTLPTSKGIKVPTTNVNEYYILDNIQKTGWNAYAHNSGLLVTHVYYNSSSWSSNTVNNYDTRRMTIIPADNSLKMNYYSSAGLYQADSNDQVGDLYPYAGNNSLTDTSTPAATTYTGTKLMGKPITDIKKNNDGTVSFVYIASAAFGGDAPELTVDESTITETGFTASWNKCTDASNYTLSLTPFNAILTDNFSGCVKASESAINGSLEQYTDVSGWIGYRTRVQEGGFRLGNTGSNGTLGSLTSPAIDLTGSEGKASVKVTAFSYDTDETSLQVSLAGKVQTVKLTKTPTDYTLSFDELTASTGQKLILSNVTKGERVTVTGVVVATPNNDEEKTFTTRNTSLTVTGLQPDSYYQAKVKATYSGGDSDWSNLVIVKTSSEDFTLGDVNNDGNINVFDIVSTARVITGKDVTVFNTKAADVNGDGNINVIDLVGIVNLALGLELNAQAALTRSTLSVDGITGNRLFARPFTLKAGETREVEILLNNADEISALQFDLQLPEEVSLSNLSVASRAANFMPLNGTAANNTTQKIVVYSNTNEAISGNNGAILTLTLTASPSFSGEGTFSLNNILMANRHMAAFNASDFAMPISGEITAIDNIKEALNVYTSAGKIVVETPNATSISITSLDGRSHSVAVPAGKSTIDLPDASGLYIVKIADKVLKIRL